ncbi:unnamed protein product [Acanthoscelides obtectus]|uniref:Uncharacterized protein n=1 Tax=Acanthoscelides obtectus TaxID=200917 RepID=A0A9P0PQP5_ACAOB|nr:unnamed protein product [Acanthoscelides obtectus]CAK1682260.1 Probable E3 ubiquitin-protein ligase RNF144A-A [Acanthoscelides obtectus]
MSKKKTALIRGLRADDVQKVQARLLLDDFLLWHRTQVVGIFASFGNLLLAASPLLLLAAPCIACSRCLLFAAQRGRRQRGGGAEKFDGRSA